MLRDAPADPVSRSSLARLLATESRLETLLVDSREQARLLLVEAEVEAVALVAALEAGQAEAAARLEQRHAAECQARLAALATEHERTITRLRDISSERISELARSIAGQVLARAATESGP